MVNIKKWYVLRTKPRGEKKTYKNLVEQDIEAYCPLQKKERHWSDRKKIIEEPLFNGYIFVRIMLDEYSKVRMTDGVVNFIYWVKKPAVVADKDIETIKRFLNEYTDVIVVKTDICLKQKVTITTGVLMNKEATVIKVMKKKVEVAIDSLGLKLVATLNITDVAIVN